MRLAKNIFGIVARSVCFLADAAVRLVSVDQKRAAVLKMAPTLTGEDKFAVMEVIHFHPLIWKTSATGTGLESSREAKGNVCETNHRGLKRLIARGLNLAYRGSRNE